MALKLHHLLLVFVGASAGCSATCPAPTTITGVRYTTFASLLTHKAVNEEAFPSYDSPANGSGRWELFWGDNDNGPITVVINGQQFVGSGVWDPIECGNFTIDVAGTYTVEEEPIHKHNIDVSGPIMFYDDRLEGRLTWRESWLKGEESGTLRGKVQLSGVARGG